jgi:fermentation-respiration switch protein FrsA (DUF1100 family)
VDYYCNLGLNVFLWNYRGYGKTKGRPNPVRLQKDGLIIVEYLKEVKKVRKLGIHGESLGGSVATYIASNTEVQFLFADRTFSSLSNVALFNFGKVAKFFFSLVTKWNQDSVTDYLNANCYKLIANDYEDNIVTDLASLKSGVATRISDAGASLLTDREQRVLIGCLSGLYT